MSSSWRGHRRLVDQGSEACEGRIKIAKLLRSRLYTGRFRFDMVTAVIEAASPIPPGDYEYIDRDEQHRSCPRHEAIIRRLEWIAAYTNFPNNDIPPSTLRKRLHAITAAATTLANLLADTDEAECLPAQVENALWAMADEEGEPDPDARLREVIEGILEVQRWSKKAAEIAIKRIDVPPPTEHDPVDVFTVSGMEKLNSKPVAEAIAGILDIWVKVLGRPIKTSTTNDGVASGPLIRFGLACLDLLELGPRIKPNALRQRIQGMQKPRFRKT